MKKPLALALCLAVGVSGVAMAAGGADTASQAAPKPVKKEKAKRVCKNDPRVTGTRIAKRICKTEDEWANKEDGQEVGVRSKNSGGNGGGI